MGKQEEPTARLVWLYGEPIHAVLFFAPETQTVTDDLGLKGGWMSYFGCRAAPLGAVSAAAVTSIFYGFHPRRVERAIPDVWTYAEPRQLLDARLSAMDVALGRLLGEAIDGDNIRRAAALATAAVHSADFSGRPLGAANAALPDPGAPHLQLWQALGAIREHRGDGHIACLVAHEIDPCESLVMQAATGRSERESLRANRGWSEEEWRMAAVRLRERGWLDDDEGPTQAGTDARDAIEAATDRLAAPLVSTLGTQGVELAEAMRPLAERIMAAGQVPKRNNMGLPWPSR
ncbi:MAG: SCO6745 family protein [Acidimicrobiales bacterium]